MYEEHLEFLSHHPSFQKEVLHLRERGPAPGTLARVAARWQMTTPDLAAFVEAETDEVALAAGHDKVFVEVRPDEYTVHVPRPLTPTRRDAVIRWAREVWRWPHPAPQSGGEVEVKRQKSGHQAPIARKHLDWYDSWLAGQSYLEIYRSLPSDQADTDPEHVRNTLRSIHARMKAIAPDGLPEAGP